jgi:hypothetical protein
MEKDEPRNVKQATSKPAGKAADRKQRLASALRDNLKKRKRQTKVRAGTGETAPDRNDA